MSIPTDSALCALLFQAMRDIEAATELQFRPNAHSLTPEWIADDHGGQFRIRIISSPVLPTFSPALRINLQMTHVYPDPITSIRSWLTDRTSDWLSELVACVFMFRRFWGPKRWHLL